eukprot:g1046.t1
MGCAMVRRAFENGITGIGKGTSTIKFVEIIFEEPNLLNDIPMLTAKAYHFGFPVCSATLGRFVETTKSDGQAWHYSLEHGFIDVQRQL